MLQLTEIKCYCCGRVCGEIEGDLPSLSPLEQRGCILTGASCNLGPKGELLCGRCGCLVYLGDTFSQYASNASEP